MEHKEQGQEQGQEQEQEERKEWEYISKEQFNSETKDFKRVLCNYIRWDFYFKEDGRRYFILSLADSRTKTIAQIVLNEKIAETLRDALNQLLSYDDKMFQ